MGLSPEWFSSVFSSAWCISELEQGNPAVISGKSGIELVCDIFVESDPNRELPEPSISLDRSPAYWAGWALADYQWASGTRFLRLFDRIPLSEILSMYPLFHEMDVERFVEEITRKFDARAKETQLKRMRENWGLSQSELSRRSGVKLRSIQLYEQRVNDIDKAQGHTLHKLACALGCSVEDLLENPRRIFD